jgi:hypothetical protein
VDGYDEVVNMNNSVMFDDFIQRVLDSESTLIMTRRSISSSQSLLNRFDVIAEIQPFSIKECELFVGEYFGYSRGSMEQLILDGRTRSISDPLPVEWSSTIESISRIARNNEVICSVPIVMLILCFIAKLEQMRGRGDLFLRDMTIVSLYELTTKYLVLAQISRKKNIPLREVDWDELEIECEKYFVPLQSLCFGIVGSVGFDRKTFNAHVGIASNTLLDDYVEIGFVRKSIIEAESNWYEFVHLSFVEYFAALSIVEQMKSQKGYDAFTLESTGGLFLYKNQYNETYLNFTQFIIGSIKDKDCFRRFMSRLGENEKIFFDFQLLVNGNPHDAPNWYWADRRGILQKWIFGCKV